MTSYVINYPGAQLMFCFTVLCVLNLRKLKSRPKAG